MRNQSGKFIVVLQSIDLLFRLYIRLLLSFGWQFNLIVIKIQRLIVNVYMSRIGKRLQKEKGNFLRGEIWEFFFVGRGRREGFLIYLIVKLQIFGFFFYSRIRLGVSYFIQKGKLIGEMDVGVDVFYGLSFFFIRGRESCFGGRRLREVQIVEEQRNVNGYWFFRSAQRLLFRDFVRKRSRCEVKV